MQNTKSGKAVWVGLVMLAVFGAVPASATTWVVASTADNHTAPAAGTLRYAILNAAPGDTINFTGLTLPATITLSGDEIHIDRNMTITGPGASNLTISGGGAFRVFEIDSATVSISGLTISNGTGAFLSGVPKTSTPGIGGGIFTAGTVTLTAVTLTGNTSLEGGAIANEGTLTVNNSTISSNTAPCSTVCNGQGGGIFNYHTLIVSGSTISGNAAGLIGGGIFSTFTGGTNSVTVTNSTISGNSAVSEGGAIFQGSGGTMTVTNSTISGNSSPGNGTTSGGQGGGIENEGTLTISGSTISGNTTNASGGGIFNNSTGTMTMLNSTISGNSSGMGGGGLENSGAMSLSFVTIWGNRTDTAGCCGGMADGIVNFGTALTVRNSVLANSTLTFKNCLFYPGYPVTSQGYNLTDDTSCTGHLNLPSDINNTPAGLDTGLKSNGGPTQTIALLAGSPAIDAIPVGNCKDVAGNPVATDQRGVTRPKGTGCDIGAFEVALAPQLVVTRSLSRDPGTGEVVVVATISNGGAAASNVQLTIAKIGSTVTTTALPQSVGTIGVGTSAQVTLRFPGSVGSPGAATTVSLGGTYTGGSFATTARATLP